ncbi:MAG: MBOAT family O-acyltransferase [Pseudomonadota bacterium]
MLFASFDFLLFFCVAFAGYWVLAGLPQLRALWILALSYFFYVAGPKPTDGPPPLSWHYVGLLFGSTALNYVCGLCIAAARRRTFGFEVPDPNDPSGIAAKVRAGDGWLWLSVVGNLGLLGYFKYTGFFFQIAKELASLVGAGDSVPTVSMVLPIGISFYTFQGIAYVVDVYRGRFRAERNPLVYAAFIAFFPQLVAGPIVRASELIPQFRIRPKLTRADVDFALFRITKGLAKKIVLADFIAASFTDSIFAAPGDYSSIENLLALYAFTLQIYADFSGYSDIAIGAARLLGMRLPENFDRPYQAVDLGDFWRRWHMTLSTWLRDYVYYPLGGSRSGPVRSLANLWITMFLVGMWHGASWNFVIYASLQACAMVYGRLCRRKKSSWFAWFLRTVLASAGMGVLGVVFAHFALGLSEPHVFGAFVGVVALVVGFLPNAERWPAFRPVHVVVTLHFVVLSRVFFRADNLELAQAMCHKVLHWDGAGVRPGLLGNERLVALVTETPLLSWARPLAEWIVLGLLILGLAIHYVPAGSVTLTAQRVVPRVPAVLLGMGFAFLIGILSLLLAGPRANIYFAF